MWYGSPKRKLSILVLTPVVEHIQDTTLTSDINIYLPGGLSQHALQSSHKNENMASWFSLPQSKERRPQSKGLENSLNEPTLVLSGKNYPSKSKTSDIFRTETQFSTLVGSNITKNGFYSESEEDESDTDKTQKNVIGDNSHEEFEMEELGLNPPSGLSRFQSLNSPGFDVKTRIKLYVPPKLVEHSGPLDLSTLSPSNPRAIPFFCTIDEIISSDEMNLLTLLDHEINHQQKEEERQNQEKSSPHALLHRLLGWAKGWLFYSSAELWDSVLRRTEEGHIDEASSAISEGQITSGPSVVKVETVYIATQD